MDIKKEVNRIIKEEIEPTILSHGGIIDIKSIEDGIVTITLKGNCSNCPSAQITTEEIVKERLINSLGEKIKDVKLYSEVSDELWDFAKNILHKRGGVEKCL